MDVSTYPSNPHAGETDEYIPWSADVDQTSGTSNAYQKRPADYSNQGKPKTKGPTP